MENKLIIAEKKILYIILTILSSLIFCVLKLMNFGWLSIFLFFPIIFYIVLYIISNFLTAIIKNKTKSDHLRFWLTSLFFLLSVLTFCDFGDVGPTSKIIKFIPDQILMCICIVSTFITIILFILSIIIYFKKLKINNNK